MYQVTLALEVELAQALVRVLVPGKLTVSLQQRAPQLECSGFARWMLEQEE